MLTVRGRVMLGIGIAVVVVSVFAGQRDVMRVGLLLILLPVLGLIYVSATRLRLSSRRSIIPERVQLGSPIIGRIRLSLESRLPIGIVMLEDDVPPELGDRPRFTIDRAGLNWQREIEYPLLGRVRGRWTCGPLSVRTADPFGLVERRQQFTAVSEVLVTPQIVPLTSVSASGGATSSGESQPHRIGVVGADDVLIREYRHGDDFRRVHWRSTARRGDLMVRREEQAWDPSARIILDSRAGAHAGPGVHNSLEWAVSAAASIGIRFIDDGYRLEVFEAEGSLRLQDLGGVNRAVIGDLLISKLTELRPRRTVSMRYGLESAAADLSGQLVVAIMGRLTSSDAHALLRTRQQRARGLVMLLDVDTFAAGPDAPTEPALRGYGTELQAASELLSSEGWRVVRVTRGMSVAEAWAQLDGSGLRSRGAGSAAAFRVDSEAV